MQDLWAAIDSMPGFWFGVIVLALAIVLSWLSHEFDHAPVDPEWAREDDDGYDPEIGW